MADPHAYTRWSVLGAGEAGCRVASHYFATHPNPAVANRILLLNSAQADLTNLYRLLEKEISGDGAKERLQLAQKQSYLFGDTAGAGNWFANGEATLLQDWEGVSRSISGTIGTAGADVMVHVCGLGGGTGNGCVPPIVYRLRQGMVPDVSKAVYHFAVGIWPYPDEANHRQFNALMGLSRLLRFGPDGELNAQFVLLLGNRELAKLASTHGLGSGLKYRELNQVVVEVLNALISPGQESSEVIDAKDYAVNAQRYEMQHFTAGVAWDVPTLFKLEEALDETLANVLLPIDPRTSISAYLILQVPHDQVDDPAFSPGEVNTLFRAWCEARGFKADTRYQSVVPNRSLQGTFHAILFLGGFDLSPLVLPQRPLAEKQIQLHTKKFGGGRAAADELETLWRNLLEYVEVSNERRQALQS